MNIFERIFFDQPGGMFREFDGLTTHFEPKDPALQVARQTFRVSKTRKV
jgi:hypothetical protein